MFVKVRDIGQRAMLAAWMVAATSVLTMADDRFRQVIDVDSWGAPPGIGKAENPQYFVWQDAQGWHVHTDSGRKHHKFNITVETVGGRVVELANISGLEGKKKKKGKDHGKLSEDRRTINATLTTTVRTDGIDFTVDANTSAVCFKLLIDGEERPQWIALGASGAQPKQAAFALSKEKKK